MSGDSALTAIQHTSVAVSRRPGLGGETAVMAGALQYLIRGWCCLVARNQTWR